MRRLHRLQLLGVLVLLHLAGCLPATATVMPEVRGRVVNAAGEPLGRATVSIAPADRVANLPSVEVTTDADGRFRRREQTRWFMALLVPADAIAPQFVATASHQGGRSTPVTFGRGLMQPHFFGVTNKREPFDLGDLIVKAR